MRFPEASIENLQALGYTEDEARFLYLVASHSGYFSTRQFLQFTGAKSGDKSMAFSQKLLGKGHATARLLLRNGRVYHVFSRLVYRAIGRENIRNRREHSPEHIRTRLVILDFILVHQEYKYLETEADKLHYFCQELRIPKALLPAKRYTGAIHSKATERYFVDKFPIFFSPGPTSRPVVTFTFIDPGLQSLDSFTTHLLAYGSLFEALSEVRLAYIAIRPTHFEAARKTFLAMLNRAPKQDAGEEILRYFQLRKAWEQKKFALFTNDDIELLNTCQKKFAGHRCEERYPNWRDGHVSDDLVRSEFRDLASRRKISFESVLVDGQAALFEAKPRKKTVRTNESEVKSVEERTFGSPFGSVFVAAEKKVAEK